MVDFAHLLAAFSRAGRSLGTPGIFWHALWPPLLATLLWTVLGALGWPAAHAAVTVWLPALPWAGTGWIADWAAGFLLVAALVALIYVTAVLFVALVALPLIIARVSSHDFHELHRHGERAIARSVANTLATTAIFLIGMALCLPLLLIPGAVLVIPLLWTAWLNQRTFRFDALAEHATAAEMRALFERYGRTFQAAGVGCALLAQIPLVNLLAPAFTALVFVHLGLMLLRNLRREQGVLL